MKCENIFLEGDILTRDSKKCHFPFVYEGVTYNKCTMAGGKDYWCATSVDHNKKYSKWDYCVFRKSLFSKEFYS